jgi:hypothetical protein
MVRRVLTGLLCCLLLVSCGSSLVYDRLDWLIPWYVDSYVDLSSEQRQTLQQQLAPLLLQHRQEELARYQQLLDGIEVQLQAPVRTAQVEGWIGELAQAATRVEQSMLQVAVDFGATISDEQMAEFLESLYSRQEDLEKELLSRSYADYAEEHTRHLEDLMQRIIGRLDRAQKQQLEQAAHSMQRYDGVWLEDRRRWLDQLQSLLQRKPGWQERVKSAYAARERSRSQEYQSIVAHNQRVIAAAIARVLNSRSDKQKARTVSEFEDLRAMLRKLMDKAPGSSGSVPGHG